MRITDFLQRFALSLCLSGLAVIFGCGGGSGTPAEDPPPPPLPMLSGTAATGLPVVSGNVAVKCAGGPALTSTSGSTGTWSVGLVGQTLPCVVQVTGGTVGGTANTTPYHSVAVTAGTVNITPLTDLLVANLAAQSPEAWFAGLGSASLNQQVTAAAVNAALTNVRVALGPVSGMASLGNVHPVTAAFNATAGDAMDDMLGALKTAIAKACSNYWAFLNAASAGGSFSVNRDSCGITGTSTLTISVTTIGSSRQPVTIKDVAKPVTRTEFCDGLTDPTSITWLYKVLGFETPTGINVSTGLCTFDGTTGSVSGYYGLIHYPGGPTSLPMPYTVVYTYSG